MWLCMVYNETADDKDPQLCQNLGLAVSILSVVYLVFCSPVSLCYNVLLVAVNLCNKSSMTMPDVYFVNIAIAGLMLNVVASVELLGPDFTRWPMWRYSDELRITLLILFNVSALVTMYSTTLLSLDCYIEWALPHTYMSSVYNTKHVCGFLWGGAVLTSFSSLLFYVCNHISAKIVECSKMQNKEVADAIMLFIGFAVPAAAVSYALVLILRIRKEVTHLDQDSGRLDPYIHRLLLSTVFGHFLLWTPYYVTLLLHSLSGIRWNHANLQTSMFYFLRCLSVLLAFCGSFVMPLLYKHMNRNFSHKFQRLLKRVRWGKHACPHERSMVQQVIT